MKLEALIAQYQADKMYALATLDVYFKNAVGIGEHPQILEEMDKLVTKLADAEGKLEVLSKYTSNQTEVNSEPAV